VKQFILSVTKDVLITLGILFFLFVFVSYARVDDYLLKHTLAPVMEQYGLSTETVEFAYVFPLRFKARGLMLGERSFIKEIDLIISPMTFFKRDGLSLLSLKISDAILYEEDLSFFVREEDEREKKQKKLDIYSLRLENIYVSRQDHYLKVENAVLSAKLGERMFISFRNIAGHMSYFNSRFLIENGQFSQTEKKADYTLAFRGLFNEGQAFFDGRIKSGNIISSLSLENVDLTGIMPGLTGRGGVQGEIKGSLKKPFFTGKAYFEDVHLGRATVQNGQYGIRITPEKISLSQIYATTGEGTLTGNLNVSLKARMGIDGDFQFNQLDFSEISSNFPLKTKLSGNISLNGKSDRFKDFNGTVKLKQLNGLVEDEKIDHGEVVFVKDRAHFRIEKASADIGREGHISLKGDYTRKFYNFDVEMKSVSLKRIFPRKQWGGAVHFKGAVNKDETGFSFMGYSTIDDLDYMERFKAESVNFFISVDERITANIYYSGLYYNDRKVSLSGKGDIDIDRKWEVFCLKNSNIVLTKDISAAVDVTARREKGKWTAASTKNIVEIRGQKVEYGFDSLSAEKMFWDVKSFFVRHRSSRTEFSFTFDRSWENSSLGIKGLIDLAEVNELFRLVPQMKGAVLFSTEKKEKGPSEIQISSDTVELQLSDFETMSYDDFFARWQLIKNELHLKEIRFDVAGKTNRLSGDFYLGTDKNPFTLNSFDVRGDLERVHSALLVNFATPDVSVTSGFFSGPVRFWYDGRFHLDADVSLDATQLIIFGLGDAFVHNIRGEAQVRDNRIIIDTFHGEVGERGKVFFKGTINDFIYDLMFDFRARFRDTMINNLWYFSGTGEGDIRLQSIEKGYTSMTGDIVVQNGLVSGDFSEMFALRDVKEVKGMDMNVHISAANNVWLRNNFTNIEIAPDFYYKRERKTDKVFFSGSIEAVKGTVKFINVPFNITEGTVSFSNSPEVLPAIDAKAETTVFYKQRIRIELNISGDILNPNVSLSADDPTLTEADIISLLTFSRPAYDMAGEDVFAQKIGEFATDYLQQMLFSPLRRSQWIDNISVRGNFLTAEDPYLDLQIGKYIRQDLYLSYQDDVFSGDTRRFDFIYYFNKNLSLQTGAAEQEGDFKYNIDFKIRFKY